jgi:ribose transport system substrate-binding protein
MKNFKAFIVIAVLVGIVFGTAGCSGGGGASSSGTNETAGVGAVAAVPARTYYYVAPYMGHPYVYDHFLGFKFAAEKFGVDIVQSGPDGFDTQAATEAFEQAIAKKPDGIVTVMWDGSLVSATRTAISQGIPVIVIETAVNNHGAYTYIGLDNYQNGVDTANELLRIAGNSGNVVLVGNWGASNTDEKLAGVKDVLKDTNWKIVAEVNDETNMEKAIEVSKAAMNNFPNVNAFIGLNSASGPGIAAAMEELNKPANSIFVVCNDREDMTLEYVEKGYINATLCNKTAMQAYLAIALLENYSRYEYADVPVSADNRASQVNVFPERIITGTFKITAENVKNFRHENMDTYDTVRYKR